MPCIIGNTSDFFNDESNKLKKYLVSTAEDNSILNAKKVLECIENKEKIVNLYKEWKEKYNNLAKKSINEFINK